jgi:hypothetical protein
VHRESPDSACACGIHAFRDPVFDLRGGQGLVARGVVFGWGRYVLGDRGWRAELCQVAALEDPGLGAGVEHRDLVGEIARRHAIPIVRALRDVRLGAFMAESQPEPVS